MQLSSQKKHHSKERDIMSNFWGNPLAYASPLARVGLSTATPRATPNANPFCGVSVSIPIAKEDLIT
ncbi:hypothetical protein SAMN05421765_0659 [Kaistella antarctica]|uniref:Uncharacterized protein n=1 Tax=Kaistella antarctica TaxID=266748 RepID=A0A3S4UZR0_9FLAO|nr:hypothetical protein SAMN05421765_0659 [Kaistella antarctica]VEI00978.1 Uncharacterised protein [Kaistella antarctica]